jgi:exopolyphosphatase/guanosine-5'-triphosphate,3'-diphosphate pyrophosphatase
MIEMKKYAAIDIGSNAMRLLIVNIVEQEVRNRNLIRVR